MSKTIHLQVPITVQIQQEVKLTFTDLVLENFNDDGTKVTADISFNSQQGFRKHLILWDGIEYTQIGQYTDTDVFQKISELLTAVSTPSITFISTPPIQ